MPRHCKTDSHSSFGSATISEVSNHTTITDDGSFARKGSPFRLEEALPLLEVTPEAKKKFTVASFRESPRMMMVEEDLQVESVIDVQQQQQPESRSSHTDTMPSMETSLDFFRHTSKASSGSCSATSTAVSSPTMAPGTPPTSKRPRPKVPPKPKSAAVKEKLERKRKVSEVHA